MNDLMRPALYGANHQTMPAVKSNNISKKLMNLLDQFAKVLTNLQL